jgi:hypothetical protein
MKQKVIVTTDPRPELSRGDDVNVDGLGRGIVLSVKPGEQTWWVEVRLEDGRGYSVPASHVWQTARAA